MKLGNKIIFILSILFFFISTSLIYSEEKIKTIPLINLKSLSPTFEEEKDELEKMENNISEDMQTNEEFSSSIKSDKVYINLRALNKITAKTSSIKIAIGEKKNFGKLEIKPLKCGLLDTQKPQIRLLIYK